jgi:hypothetical protein
MELFPNLLRLTLLDWFRTALLAGPGVTSYKEEMNRMKKICIAAILILFSICAHAQVSPDANVMAQLASRIGLSAEETETLVEIYTQAEIEIREADLELDIYKAQLARLLFPAEVDMQEVEDLLKKSYEWQLKRQLAQIRRQVEIRKLLGEDRWIQYSRLVRSMQKRAANSAAEEKSADSGTGR